MKLFSGETIIIISEDFKENFRMKINQCGKPFEHTF